MGIISNFLNGPRKVTLSEAPKPSNKPSFNETKLIFFTILLDKIIRKEFYGTTRWEYIGEADKEKVGVRIYKNSESFEKSYYISDAFIHKRVRPIDIEYIKNSFDENKQKERKLLDEIEQKLSMKDVISVDIDISNTSDGILEKIFNQLSDNGLNYNYSSDKLTIYLSALDEDIQYHFTKPEIGEVKVDISKFDLNEIFDIYYDYCVDAELKTKYPDMVSWSYNGDEYYIMYRSSRFYNGIDMTFSDGRKQCTALYPSTFLRETKKISITKSSNKTTEDTKPEDSSEKLKEFLYELIERVETTNEYSFTVEIKQFTTEELEKIVDILSREGINSNLSKEGLIIYIPERGGIEWYM